MMGLRGYITPKHSLPSLSLLYYLKILKSSSNYMVMDYIKHIIIFRATVIIL